MATAGLGALHSAALCPTILHLWHLSLKVALGFFAFFHLSLRTVLNTSSRDVFTLCLASYSSFTLILRLSGLGSSSLDSMAHRKFSRLAGKLYNRKIARRPSGINRSKLFKLSTALKNVSKWTPMSSLLARASGSSLQHTASRLS